MRVPLPMLEKGSMLGPEINCYNPARRGPLTHPRETMGEISCVDKSHNALSGPTGLHMMSRRANLTVLPLVESRHMPLDKGRSALSATYTCRNKTLREDLAMPLALKA